MNAKRYYYYQPTFTLVKMFLKAFLICLLFITNNLLGQRNSRFDIAFPKDINEYKLMGGNAVIYISSESNNKDELPLKRCFILKGNIEFELERLDNFFIQDGNIYCSGEFYIVPLTLINSNSVYLIVDFKANRENFLLGSLSLPTNLPYKIIKNFKETKKTKRTIFDKFCEREFPTEFEDLNSKKLDSSENYIAGNNFFPLVDNMVKKYDGDLKSEVTVKKQDDNWIVLEELNVGGHKIQKLELLNIGKDGIYEIASAGGLFESAPKAHSEPYLIFKLPIKIKSRWSYTTDDEVIRLYEVTKFHQTLYINGKQYKDVIEIQEKLVDGVKTIIKNNFYANNIGFIMSEVSGKIFQFIVD